MSSRELFGRLTNTLPDVEPVTRCLRRQRPLPARLTLIEPIASSRTHA